MIIKVNSIAEFMAIKNVLNHAFERFEQRWEVEPENHEQLKADMEFINKSLREIEGGECQIKILRA